MTQKKTGIESCDPFTTGRHRNWIITVIICDVIGMFKKGNGINYIARDQYMVPLPRNAHSARLQKNHPALSLLFLWQCSDVGDWPFISMLSAEEVVRQRDNGDASINHNIPVHVGRRWVRGARHKGQYKNDNEESLRSNVDGKTPLAQAKLGAEKRAVGPAPPDHAANGHNIT